MKEERTRVPKAKIESKFTRKVKWLISTTYTIVLFYAFYLTFSPPESMTFLGISVSKMGYIFLFIGIWTPLFLTYWYKVFNLFDLKEDDILAISFMLGILGVMMMFSISLETIGYILLGISAFMVLMVFVMLFSCDGGGCISGVLLVPLVFFVPLGLVLIGYDFA